MPRIRRWCELKEFLSLVWAYFFLWWQSHLLLYMQFCIFCFPKVEEEKNEGMKRILVFWVSWKSLLSKWEQDCLRLCYLKQHPADHWYLEDNIHSSIQFSKNCVQFVLVHICSMFWGWVAVIVLKIWNDWKLFNLSASGRYIFVTDTNNLK